MKGTLFEARADDSFPNPQPSGSYGRSLETGCGASLASTAAGTGGGSVLTGVLLKLAGAAGSAPP
eukprot:1131991-Amphidinium_carterae.2